MVIIMALIIGRVHNIVRYVMKLGQPLVTPLILKELLNLWKNNSHETIAREKRLDFPRRVCYNTGLKGTKK